MSAYEKTLSCLDSATSIPVGTTEDLSTSANVIDVRRNPSAALYLYVKGADAGCSGNATFYFQRTTSNADDATWHDLPEKEVAFSGTTQSTADDTNFDLDLANTRFLRLSRVANSDTTAGHTISVNAYIQLR